MNKKVSLILLAIIIIVLVIFWVNTSDDRVDVTLQNGDSEIETEREVDIFYYSPEKDMDETGNVLCSDKGLVSVSREVSKENPIEDAIRVLLSGEITEEEIERLSIETEYPLSGLEFIGLELENGNAYLEFSDPSNQTSGGSCRAGILWLQIAETVKQFEEVDNVYFLPEDELFQP